MARPDERRTRAMFLIVELGRRMTEPVELIWGDVGLSPTEGTLLARLIVTFNGRARSGELVGYPVRSTAALAKVLAGLEADGLIARTRRDDDRRVVEVQATEAARQLFRQVFTRIATEVAEPTAEPLDDRQLDTLQELLERLTPPTG